MPILDKLTLINDELAQTGNNLVALADDGSDEWIATSRAYDNAVATVVEEGSWNFDTRIVTLQRAGDAEDDTYADAFARPADCLHLIWVRLRDQSVDYKIIDNQICLNARGLTVTAKYVRDDSSKPWPQVCINIIRDLVRAAIYRGLHEDPQQADREEQKAQMRLQEARTRVDQENPKRAPFNSRARSARFVRRPFIRQPQGWSGTGVPD